MQNSSCGGSNELPIETLLLELQMSTGNFENHIINRLRRKRGSLSNLAQELNLPDERAEESVAILVSKGIVGVENESYFLIDRSIANVDLSEIERKLIATLREVGAKAAVNRLTFEVGKDKTDAALSKLERAGILVRDQNGQFKLTARSELKIPLSKSEKVALAKAEKNIEAASHALHAQQLLVARELRTIRDQKLYRETHSRFGDYVAEKFERTRDWAYKMIAELEVQVGLCSVGDENVEALLHSVTARDFQQLAKLKNEPIKMLNALKSADAIANNEKRKRNTDDLKNEVNPLMPRKNKKQEQPFFSRTINFDGIDRPDETTIDIQSSFVNLARWLRRNPQNSAFAIQVSAVVPHSLQGSGNKQA